MNILNPFRAAEKSPTNQLAPVITELRELLAATERYSTRRASIEAEAATPPTSFDLTPDSCRAYAETTAALAYAQKLEDPLREKIRHVISEAGRTWSRSEDRIRNLHAEIDTAIRDAVVASLPAELEGVEVTCETDLAFRGNALIGAVGAGKVGNRISIWSTAPGRAEASARLNTGGLGVGPLGPRDPIPEAQTKLAAAVATLERLAAEEDRCRNVLTSLKAA